jgi:hypothetical protein
MAVLILECGASRRFWPLFGLRAESKREIRDAVFREDWRTTSGNSRSQISTFWSRAAAQAAGLQRGLDGR